MRQRPDHGGGDRQPERPQWPVHGPPPAAAARQQQDGADDAGGAEGDRPGEFLAEPEDAERGAEQRSEEHTSELQSLMRRSYAVFCLKKKKTQQTPLKNNVHMYKHD